MAPPNNYPASKCERMSLEKEENLGHLMHSDGVSLMAQRSRMLLQCRRHGRQNRPLSWEDPLEKEMATHSSILAWRSPWTEEPGGLQSRGSQRVGHD